MLNNFRQLLILISAVAVIFILSGQTASDNKRKAPQLPTSLSKRLDSLRSNNNLTEWLYAYREYVYEDPANRVAMLTYAQSTVWRTCNNDTERIEWINGLAAQGYYLLYSGNILGSIDAYEQAYRFYFQKPLAGFDVLEYVLKPLGNNYTRLGDYDRAFFIQEKSLALAEANDSLQIAPICHNLATTAIWKEDMGLAKQYCERGLDKVKKNTAFNGLLLSTLAEILLKSGKISEATISINESIKMLSPFLADKTAINAAYWLRGAWQGKGDIEKEKRQPAAALVAYKKAMDIIDRYYKGERKREKAQLLVSMGLTLLQMQQPVKANDQFNAALSLLIPAFRPSSNDELPLAAELYGESTLSDALHGKADCLYAINQKDAALQCYLLLFVTERKLNNEIFSSEAKQQQKKESRRWSEAAMNTAYELWKISGRSDYAGKVLLIAELSKAQLLLAEIRDNQRYNSTKHNDTLFFKQVQLARAINFYEKEIALNILNQQADSNARAAKKALQFELALIQKQEKEKLPLVKLQITEAAIPSADNLLQNIPANTTAIEFFSGEKTTYIIKADKSGIRQIVKLDNAAQLKSDVNKFVTTYFQQGPANMMNNPRDYYSNAFSLYHQLLQDSTTALPQNCIIIPDGVFGYLPFEALVTDTGYMPNPGQWPYLIKRSNLYYNYSLQKITSPQQATTNSASFAGFFISFDSSSTSAIPAVKKEYEEIHAVTEGNFYLEEKATLEAFNKSLGQVNILHISTHSFLEG